MTTSTVTTTSSLALLVEAAVGDGASYPYWRVGMSRVGAGAWWPAPAEERGYAWVDITRSVRTVFARSGRSRMLEGYDSAYCSLTLDNVDSYGGQWAPHNPDSPWKDATTGASTLRAGAWIRVSAVVDGVASPLFTGVVMSWDTSDTLPSWSEVRVEAADVFRIWSAYDGPALTGQGTGETVDARLERIADLIGWDRERLDLEAGINTLQSTELAGNALTMARLFSDSDAGELFADQRGVIVWRNRRHRFTATRSTIAQWAIGNGPGRDLLTNGSLDAVTGGTLTGWTTSGTVTLSSTAVRGRHAAEMAASATLTSTAASVSAGIDYTATLAANGTGSLTLDVEWRTGGGVLISTSSATLICTGPGTWDWHQATFTAPATAETATVVVTNSAAGAATVDEVSLQADPQNLITTNPGFEDDPFSDGWTITAGSGTVTADTDGPHTGNTAALLACASGTPPVVVSPAATVNAGTVVVVTIAARSDSSTPLGVRLDFFDGGGSALHQATLETPDGTWTPGPTWSTFTASVTVPASAATAKLRLAPTTTGNVWVDTAGITRAAAAAELVTNGGFETVGGSPTPAGWTTSGTVTSSTSTWPSRTGWSASIAAGAHMDNGAAGAAIELDRPTVAHELVLWHRAVSGSPTLTVDVSWETAADAAISTTSTTVSPGAVWDLLTLALTPPTTAAKAWVRISAATAAVLVDAVALREASSSMVPARDVNVVADASRLVTTAVVSHVGGTEQTYEDTAAVAANGGRPVVFRRNDLTMQTNNQAADVAEWAVRVGATRATPRVDEVIIDPLVHHAAARVVSAVAFGDRVAVVAWRPNQPDPVALDEWVEGVVHDIASGAGPSGFSRWTVRLRLSTIPDDATLVTL